MAKTGRPLAPIDKTQFENLCFMQCTLEEISSFFRVNENTIRRFCKREYDETFETTYKRASAGGKTSLRREQWKSAKNGNVTMQIWLGKQWLGQAEKTESRAETIFATEPEIHFNWGDNGRGGHEPRSN